MKYLLFSPLLALCLSFDLGEKSPESMPEYSVTYSKSDPTIPHGRAQIEFTFKDEFGPADDTIRLSYNGVERTFIANKDGKVYLGVKSGKYKFQFYLDENHFEVYTDSIELKSGYKTGITVWFQNSTIPVMAEKPVIYVYPDKTQQVNIQLGLKGKLGFTYPEYNADGAAEQRGWNFTADPDGTIRMNGKQYDYLFWEGETSMTPSDAEQNTGFVVERDGLTGFFEEKLTAMGLNAREQEDFITYWCPRMQEKEKYFIHFMFTAEYDEIVGMKITPTPDHVFRVFMLWEDGTNRDENRVTAQVIQPFSREGFTVVEWGGGEINARHTVSSAQ